ncbi:MAG: trypsin-like peptidase domain-containing protein [Clostridiales bacterium]|nr:trypsin-like peptidase domain-containing protein [Clostridiales bacterium]
MKKCKICGGPCSDIGGGQYMCDFCGQTFSESDFVSREKMMVKESMSGADLYERNVVGTLEIHCSGKDGSWSGSGYIITDDGYAITNAHVAANEDGSPCRDITVKVCGERVPASVVALADNKAGSGSGIDIALIKLTRMPRDARKLDLIDSDTVRTGDTVYVIGNSLGEGTSITSGIIGDRNRNGRLMYDSATNPGNSGGPVFNADGKVIGTHVAGRRTDDGGKAQGMNFAIPSHDVIEFVRRRGITV